MKREKNVTQPLIGHLSKSGEGDLPGVLREFRVDDVSGYELGQELDVEIFDDGEVVDVSGVTKGRGFQGVIKRYGFSGGDATHGNTAHRVPGSIGASATPSKVMKNKKMPGRNYLFIKGAVPGPNSRLVTVYKKNNPGAEK